MPETPELLADPADVTAHWLTDVLRSAGHDVVVASVTSEPVGTGQMAHNERYTIGYDPADSPGASDAPATVVIKFPSPSEESRAAGAAGGYRTEIGFYTDLADELAIEVPGCLFATVADDGATFTLVLEDLAPARQGDQIAGADDHQVVAAVRNLAGLHAPRWGDDSLHDLDWLMAAGGEAIGYVELVTPMFVDRYADRMSADARLVVEAFAADVGNWIEREPTVRTLVHGDYRLDNLMFATEAGGRPVSAVDWQTLGIGAGGRDVAYLLGNSVEPDDRRRHEAEALDAYRDAMGRLGVDLTAEEVLEQYRHGTFQGPFITMLGSIAVGQTERGDQMFMAMLERSVAQILDHDALTVIS
jgi:aminoglycoside/choline kinase family phosphotransferase